MKRLLFLALTLVLVLGTMPVLRSAHAHLAPERVLMRESPLHGTNAAQPPAEVCNDGNENDGDWLVDCADTELTTTVTMDADKTVTANFARTIGKVRHFLPIIVKQG